MSSKPLTIDDLVLKLVLEDRIPRSSPHDCPYLDDLVAVEEGFMVERIRGLTYHHLMNLGFRRSGQIFYRPRCTGCTKCVQIRVPVADFRPSKSQRRARNRNTDLTFEVGRPDLTDEKLDIYTRYLEFQHPASNQTGDIESLRSFLYTSSVDTVEAVYRDADGEIVAVSILDICSQSLSSVYHFFDPEHAHRSIGVHSVLREIEWALANNIPYYYLGYWVAQSRTMDYKATFGPHEILIDGEWVRRERQSS